MATASHTQIQTGISDHEDDHAHDEHGGNFWTTHIFSQDHKTIAKQFLILLLIQLLMS